MAARGFVGTIGAVGGTNADLDWRILAIILDAEANAFHGTREVLYMHKLERVLAHEFFCGPSEVPGQSRIGISDGPVILDDGDDVPVTLDDIAEQVVPGAECLLYLEMLGDIEHAAQQRWTARPVHGLGANLDRSFRAVFPRDAHTRLGAALHVFAKAIARQRSILLLNQIEGVPLQELGYGITG